MNKNALCIGLLIICIIGILPTTAGIANLTSAEGSSWIRWSWNYTEGTTQVAVYADGYFDRNTTSKQYLLSDLKPVEEHSIALANVASGDIFGRNTTKTTYPLFLFYTLFLFGFTFLMITLFHKEIVTSSIIGCFGVIINIATLRFSYILNYTVLSYVCVAMAILCVLLLLSKAFTYIGEGVDI